MLEEIRSKYFVNNLFLYLHHKTRLNLLKYNKTLQKSENIDIFHYKNFSNKFIEHIDNGKVLEINRDGKIIFEGEYSNNKRNGKGKEYDGLGEFNNLGDIIFEGEYLTGKRWNGICYNKKKKFMN